MTGPYKPKPCRGCGEGVGSGSVGGWCSDCEPLTCTCTTPRPDAIGECAGCHRLCLSHSWHAGRPDAGLLAEGSAGRAS